MFAFEFIQCIFCSFHSKHFFFAEEEKEKRRENKTDMIGSKSCIDLFFSVRRFLSVLIVRMLLLLLVVLMLDQRCFDVLFLLSVQGLWIFDIEFNEQISELIRIRH